MQLRKRSHSIRSQKPLLLQREYSSVHSSFLLATESPVSNDEQRPQRIEPPTKNLSHELDDHVGQDDRIDGFQPVVGLRLDLGNNPKTRIHSSGTGDKK